MYRTLLALTVLAAWTLTGAVCDTVAATPRVALVYSDYGEFRHRDDYDGKMKSLGWPMDKYENTKFGELAGQLDQYDMILGTALFNYSNIQDFSAQKQQLLAFMKNGGAVVLTDCNYPPHVDWLSKLEPGGGWSVDHKTASQVGVRNELADPGHALLNLPNPLPTWGGTWAGMVPADGWRVLVKSIDGDATMLFRSVGKGYMLLTCSWGHPTTFLKNIWATLQAHRAGMLPVFPDYAGVGLGEKTLTVGADNTGSEPMDCAVEVTVLKPSGEEATRSAELKIAPGERATADLALAFEERGAYHMTTTWTDASGAVAFAREHDGPSIPALMAVTITRPRYRGMIFETAPVDSIGFDVVLHPYQEKLEDLSAQPRLLQGDEVLSEAPAHEVAEPKFSFELPLAEQPTGDVTVQVVLTSKGQAEPLAVVNEKVPLIAAREPQVFIDETLATRVNGELYFPIGVYHVPISALPKARELGFNCFQGWGTTLDAAQQNLDAAAANDMTVLLEMSAFLRGTLNLDGFDRLVDALKDHPALLSWYTVDEPDGDEQLSWCKQAREHVIARDPHHPVYLVMCSPGAFERFGSTTDILAVDPYPIPNSVVMVSDWMKRAQEAVNGLKPIWVIPQLHNWAAYQDPNKGRYPTPEEERNMVYQGLIWGAKGVIYYPWDDGPTGLTHDEKLMEAVGEINAELAVIGIELLKCSHTVTAQNDDAHPDLYAATFSGDGVSYIIAASVSGEEADFTVPAQGLADGAVEVMFEDRSAQLRDEAIADHFAPLEVHVYRVK